MMSLKLMHFHDVATTLFVVIPTCRKWNHMLTTLVQSSSLLVGVRLLRDSCLLDLHLTIKRTYVDYIIFIYGKYVR